MTAALREAEAFCLLLGEAFSIAVARRSINTDMHIFLPDTQAIALSSVVAAHTVTDQVGTPHALAIQKSQLARVLARIAPQQSDWITVRKLRPTGVAERPVYAY